MIDRCGALDTSQVVAFAERLVRSVGRERAHAALDVMLERFNVVELAALAADWSFWARPKQIPPPGPWRSWGFLAGRGFGKTLACSNHVNKKVRAGRAKAVGLAAQDEDMGIAIQIKGPSGLIATAAPDFKPVWEATAKTLVWPNGARAIVRTPEVPGKIRGLDYDLSWITELQSWPAGTRDEALMNFKISTRIGDAQFLWDATPKRGHPLLLELLADAEADPELNLIVRGTTRENTINLARNYVQMLERKYGGTARGREELDGEMLTEAEHAVVAQEWIDRARRARPDHFLRRALAIDPAVTAREGSDRTGIVEAGLGPDEEAYVLGDYSGKHEPHEWSKLVLDKYVANRIDVVVVETNKGGSLVTQTIRAAAQERELSVMVVKADDKPRHHPRTVYVKEVYARGDKMQRAEPLSTAYEARRVHHVDGADLGALELTITTWEPKPNARSPDDLDALVHVVNELLELGVNETDNRVGFEGIAQAAKVLERPQAASDIVRMLGGHGRGRI